MGVCKPHHMRCAPAVSVGHAACPSWDQIFPWACKRARRRARRRACERAGRAAALTDVVFALGQVDADGGQGLGLLLGFWPAEEGAQGLGGVADMWEGDAVLDARARLVLAQHNTQGCAGRQPGLTWLPRHPRWPLLLRQRPQQRPSPAQPHLLMGWAQPGRRPPPPRPPLPIPPALP